MSTQIHGFGEVAIKLPVVKSMLLPVGDVCRAVLLIVATEFVVAAGAPPQDE